VKFLFDHDVPDGLRDILEELGHEVFFVRQRLSPTAPDPEVLACAFANDLILVTCNRNDFLELSKSQGHHGIIVIIRRKRGLRSEQLCCGCCSAREMAASSAM